MPRRKPVNPQPSKKDGEEEGDSKDGEPKEEEETEETSIPPIKKFRSSKEEESTHQAEKASSTSGVLTRSKRGQKSSNQQGDEVSSNDCSDHTLIMQAAYEQPAEEVVLVMASDPQERHEVEVINLKTGVTEKAMIMEDQESNSELSQAETVQENISSETETHVSKDNLVIVSPGKSTTDQNEALSDDKAEGGEEKRHLSLEALFQAAHTELQNISKCDTDPVTDPTSVVITVSSSTNLQQAQGNTSTAVLQVVEQDPGETPVPIVIQTPEGGQVTGHLIRYIDENGQQQLRIKTGVSAAVLEGHQATTPVSVYKESDEPPMVTVIQATAVTPSASNAGRKRKHPAKPGKHICPYCGRGCAKPSVLEKHIRAHTGERPYPCEPCGFSFKTKSNLYKHRKSISHAYKVGLALTINEGAQSMKSSLDESPGHDEGMDDESDTEDSEHTGQETVTVNGSDDVYIIASSGTKSSSQLLGSGGTMVQQAQHHAPTITRLITNPQQLPKIRAVVSGTSTGGTSTNTTYMVIEELKTSSPPTQVRTVPSSVTVMPGGSMVPTVPTQVAQPQAQKVNVVKIMARYADDPAQCPPTQTKLNIPVKATPVVEPTSLGAQIVVSGQTVSTEKANPGPSLSFSLPVVETPSREQLTSRQTSTLVPTLPKPAPAKDLKNMTPEMLRDRISWLISSNAAIVDTPMADAPRPKRMSRQGSEVGSDIQVRTPSLTTAPTHYITSLTPSLSEQVFSEDVVASNQIMEKEIHKSTEVRLTDITPAIDIQPQVSPNPHQYFLGLAEPSDQPPGPCSPSSSVPLILAGEALKPGVVQAKPQQETDKLQKMLPQEIKIQFKLPKEGFVSDCVKTSQTKDTPGSDQKNKTIRQLFNPEGSAIKDLLLQKTPTKHGPVLVNTSTILGMGKIQTAEKTLHTSEFTAIEDQPVEEEHRDSDKVTPQQSELVIVVNEDGTEESVYVRMTNDESDDAEKMVSLPCDSNYKPMIIDVLDPKQPARRGRPKGSRNKPKLHLSIPQPPIVHIQTENTESSISGSSCTTTGSTEVHTSQCSPQVDTQTSAQNVPSWKLKLKGRLLMKRSMSVERMLSQEREELEKLGHLASKVKSIPNLTASLERPKILTARDMLKRSHSLDLPQMPVKKRILPEITSALTSSVDSKELFISTGCQKQKVIIIDEDSSQGVPVLQVQNQTKMSPVSFKDNSLNFVMPVNQVTQYMCHTKPVFSPSLKKTGSDKRIPNILTIPMNLAIKVPGLVEQAQQIEPKTNQDSEPVTETSSANRTKEEQEPDLDVISKDDDSGIVEHKAVQLFGGTKELQQKLVVTMLLLGHSYPQLRSTNFSSFCSVLKPQPCYVEQGANKKISMYSNWRAAPMNRNFMGLSTKEVLSLYETQYHNTDPRYCITTINKAKSGVLTHSSYWTSRADINSNGSAKEDLRPETLSSLIQIPDLMIVESPSLLKEVSEPSENPGQGDEEATSSSRKKLRQILVDKAAQSNPHRIKIFPGGYKSTEDYVYVRGRGRGKYVCEECGIRCKKPSMLKKHIRTHTDFRPYQCQFCHFKFKTKGNLTKHMKSKAHHKRCSELGISPVPISINLGNIDSDALARQDKLAKSSYLLKQDSMGQFSDAEDEEEEDENGEDEDLDEEEGGEEEVEEEGEPFEIEQAAAVESITVKESGEDEGKDMPRYIAIQSDGSTQPAYLRIEPGGHTVFEVRHPAQTSDNADQQNDDYPRASIDKEIAASLLDLSKGTEGGEAEAGVAKSGAVGDGRLTNLIGALMSRTTESQRADGHHDNQKGSTGDLLNTDGSTSKDSEGQSHMMGAGFVPPVLVMSGSNLVQVHSPQLLTSVARGSDMGSPGKLFIPGLHLPPIATKSAGFDGVRTKNASSRSNNVEYITIMTTGAQPVTIPIKLPQAESAKSDGVGSKNVAVSYVSGDNKAPFEIVPIPGKVVESSCEFRDGKYVCNTCDKTFRKQHELTLHKQIHLFECLYKCDDCQLSFRTQAALDKHRRSDTHLSKVNLNHHFGTKRAQDPRPFKCEDCHVGFRSHSFLAKHLRSRAHILQLESLGRVPAGTAAQMEGKNLKDLVTLDCDSNLESIQQVLEVSTTSGGSGLEDGEAVQEERVTVEYQTDHHPNLDHIIAQRETPQSTLGTQSIAGPGPHKCGICGRGFEHIQQLKSHLVGHAELRPYVCEYCDAGFTTAQSLKFHLRTHVQERPYVCGTCGDTFARSDHLQQHHKIHNRTEVKGSQQSVVNVPLPGLINNQGAPPMLSPGGLAHSHSQEMVIEDGIVEAGVSEEVTIEDSVQEEGDEIRYIPQEMLEVQEVLQTGDEQVMQVVYIKEGHASGAIHGQVSHKVGETEDYAAHTLGYEDVETETHTVVVGSVENPRQEIKHYTATYTVAEDSSIEHNPHLSQPMMVDSELLPDPDTHHNVLISSQQSSVQMQPVIVESHCLQGTEESTILREQQQRS